MATKSPAKLKAEMLFNSDLTRLVDAMKGVAAAQYFTMEHRKSNLARSSQALEELFDVYDFRRSFHPFVRLASEKKYIVLVTTDSGFMGGLNMKVLNAGLRLETSGSRFLVIGERGVNSIKEFGKQVDTLPGINPDDSRFELQDQLIAQMIQAVAREGFGQVILVAPRALSFTVQRVESWNLIPCPIFFKNKPEFVPTKKMQQNSVILESSEGGIIEKLAVLWLRKRLTEIFEDAKLAEFGARTMHLEESFQTLTKIDKQLKLQFFKARREKIDQSLRESFTSQLMCEK